MGFFSSLFEPDAKILHERHDIDGLIKIVQTSKNFDNIRDAMAYIRQMKDPKGVDSLILQLDNPNKNIQTIAIGNLSEIGNKKSIDALISKKDRSPELNEFVIHCLNSYCYNQLDGLTKEECLIYRILQDKPYSRDDLIGSSSFVKYKLHECAISDNPNIRERAFLPLRIAENPKVDPTLISLLSDEEIKLESIWKLIDIDSPIFVNFFINALNDSDIKYRKNVLTSLIKFAKNISDERLIETIIAQIQHPDEIIRYKTFDLLAAMNHPSVIEPSSRLFSEAKNPYVRIDVIKRLGMMNNPQAVDILIRALDDDFYDDDRYNDYNPIGHYPVRDAAVKVLGEIKDPRAGNFIWKSIDNKKDLRIFEIIALANCDHDIMVNNIVASLTSPDENVRNKYSFAIGNIQNPRIEAALKIKHKLDKENNKDPATLASYHRLLSSRNHSDRTEAAKFLIEKGGIEGVRLIAKAIKSDNESESDIAKWAFFYLLPDCKLDFNEDELNESQIMYNDMIEFLINEIKNAELLHPPIYFDNKTYRNLEILKLNGNSSALPALNTLLERLIDKRQKDGFVKKCVEIDGHKVWIDNDVDIKGVKEAIDAIKTRIEY